MEKKYNLGNYESLGLAIGLAPEQGDHQEDYEKMCTEAIQKLSNLLDANKNKIVAEKTSGQPVPVVQQ